MERKTWNVELDGKQHEVVLEWSYWGGKRTVHVDGAVVDENNRVMRWKSRQEITVGGHPGVVETRPSSKLSPYFVVELSVDGELVQPTQGDLGRWEVNGPGVKSGGKAPEDDDGTTAAVAAATSSAAVSGN